MSDYFGVTHYLACMGSIEIKDHNMYYGYKCSSFNLCPSKFGHRHATRAQNAMCPIDYLKVFMLYVVLFKC
jgi:hypothetical protein